MKLRLDLDIILDHFSHAVSVLQNETFKRGLTSTADRALVKHQTQSLSLIQAAWPPERENWGRTPAPRGHTHGTITKSPKVLPNPNPNPAPTREMDSDSFHSISYSIARRWSGTSCKSWSKENGCVTSLTFHPQLKTLSSWCKHEHEPGTKEQTLPFGAFLFLLL